MLLQHTHTHTSPLAGSSQSENIRCCVPTDSTWSLLEFRSLLTEAVDVAPPPADTNNPLQFKPEHYKKQKYIHFMQLINNRLDVAAP